MVSSDLIHDPAIFTHLVGPFNSTAYNSSPKFCPNDYISKDLLLCIAAGKRLEDQFSTKFAEGRAFFSCQNVLLIIFHRTHTHTNTCVHKNVHSRFSLSISATHTGTLCIQAAMCSSCSVSIWAAFHCAVVTLSFYTTLTTQ